MMRRQRRAHLAIWTALAMLLPLALLVIFALAASETIERVPVKLEGARAATGTGG